MKIFVLVSVMTTFQAFASDYSCNYGSRVTLAHSDATSTTFQFTLTNDEEQMKRFIRFSPDDFDASKRIDRVVLNTNYRGSVYDRSGNEIGTAAWETIGATFHLRVGYSYLTCMNAQGAAYVREKSRRDAGYGAYDPSTSAGCYGFRRNIKSCQN